MGGFPLPLIVGGTIAAVFALILLILMIVDEVFFDGKISEKVYVPFAIGIPLTVVCTLLFALVCILLHIPISHI